MTPCWPEGELRAYLDRELPVRDMETVSAHLEECADCRELHDQLESRAHRITAWMEALPLSKPVAHIPSVSPKRRQWRWAAAGVAVAASLLVAVLLRPKDVAPEPPSPVPAQRPANPPQVAVAPAPEESRPVTQRPMPARRRAVPVKPKPQVQYYIALDDEPIETGLVVRVRLAGSQIPADVIVGPDGRPRAVQLVNEVLGER